MNDEDLFHLALEKPTGERSAFLDRACADDVSRRRRVEILLRSHETPDSFLAGPAADVVVMASEAPAALCPRCLLGSARGDDPDVTHPFLPGRAGRVLETLAATVGPIPRVLLPDTQGREDRAPVIQPSSPEMPSPADRTGRVTLLGEIARGGMGAVLKGHDPDLGRDLAVKVLLETHREKAELVRRFIEEAQIAGQLQHPGIVPVYELGAFGDARPYFTMKLVKGSTLAQLLADRPTPEAERSRFLGIFEQVCQTVAYAHARGVIHRDLKPSNVMVGSFGEVQVMDWGLAKVLPRGGAADDDAAGRTATPVQETVIATARREPDSDLSRAGSVLGTPSYMAPEQARGEIGSVDERADVFALGSILCEVLTGGPAFTGRTSGEIQRKAARGELAEASSRLAGCGADGELAALARDCLALEPDDRPRDAGAVVARLTAYLEGVRERLHAAELAHAAESARAEEAVRTAEAAEARSIAERRARRLTAALAASVIGLVVLGGGGAAWLQRQHAARSAATARVVHEALGEALRLEGETQAAAADDPARWAAALAEARRADGLLRQGDADPALGLRVAAVLSSLKQRHDEAAVRAERTRVDRELLTALDRARFKNHVGDAMNATDKQYAAAFRAAGLDVDRSEAAEVGAWVAGRSAPVEIAAYLDDWTRVRRFVGAADGRRPWTHLNAAARAADPDPWRDTLRAGLADDATALRALADDEQGLKGRSVMGLNLLAMYLQDFADDPRRAERVLRLSWKQSPDDYWTNFLLAEVLNRKRPAASESLDQWHQERVRYLTAAISARPETLSAFTRLGDALKEAGRLEEAIDAYREEVRRNPVDTRALAQLTRLVGAGVEGDQGLARLRDAARPGAGSGEYFDLGLALVVRGEYEETITAYREAVRIDGKRVGEAIFHLGEVYRRMGRYEEATGTYRRAAELARAEGRLDLVERAEKDLDYAKTKEALAARLPGLISGKDRPTDAYEIFEILCLCRDRSLNVTGARIWEEAFKANPRLTDDTETVNRLIGACCAALAGCGKGVNVPPPDDAEKVRLRALALTWLRSHLAPLRERLETATPAERAADRRRLEDWRADPDFACVRLPVALAKLPAAEQEAWRALWDEIDALIVKARSTAP